jgi:SAM-dependent methyltransferase
MLKVIRSAASRFKKALLGPANGSPQRQRLARAYLRGQGIEIGALHNPLKVPRGTRVSYVDRMTVPELRRQYPELASLDLVDVDVVDDGEKLATIADGSQDFVIANHFLEHCPDPIGALKNFLRVLRPAGVLYLAVPDKRYTFDRDRPVTPPEHLWRDHEVGPGWSRQQHFEEWVRLVGRITDPDQVEGSVRHLMALDYSIHYHVWTQAEMLALLGSLGPVLAFDVELFVKNGHEMIFILRKARAGEV